MGRGFAETYSPDPKIYGPNFDAIDWTKTGKKEVAVEHVEVSELDPITLVKNQDTDALKWAKSFKHYIPGIPGEDDMLGWFASAIMTKHDQLHNEKIRVLEAKLMKLKMLLLLTDETVGHVVVDETQIIQWNEFITCFPDEGDAVEKK